MCVLLLIRLQTFVRLGIILYIAIVETFSVFVIYKVLN